MRRALLASARFAALLGVGATALAADPAAALSTRRVTPPHRGASLLKGRV
jgi:hypothetical protein